MNNKESVLVDCAVLFYHSLMNWQQVWGVLKWVLAALVAGFIGQFGKSLALHLMTRRRNRRKQPKDSAPVGASGVGSISNRGALDSSDRAKAEKKRIKAQVKRLKKS